MTIVVNQSNRIAVVRKPDRVVKVADVGIQGPQGPLGPAGGSTFVHTQLTPSATWTVNHDLGRRPSPVVYTPGWVEVDASIAHATANQLIVSFNNPTTGFVVCA